LFGLLIACLVTSPAAAQHFNPWYGREHTQEQLEYPAHPLAVQPFVDPGYFEYDMQFFAPASDIDTYGDDPVMRYGWFGSYNRMYIRISRPDPVDEGLFELDQPTTLVNDNWTDGDFTWGNRWDIGYMMDDVDHDHGWLFSYIHIDGPNVYDRTYAERLGRVNEDDEGMPDADDDDPPDPVNPPQDRNDVGPPDRQRRYLVSNSLNDGNLMGFEFNKLFRTKPLNKGQLLEPFFGFRYLKFDDIFQRQGYYRYDDTGLQPIWPPLPPTDQPIAYDDATIEDLITDRYSFTNHMVGGQLGFRLLHRVSRWNLSAECRVFGFGNFQKHTYTHAVVRTYNDGDPEAQIWTRSEQTTHKTSAVVGTDIRAEAAYELTRDVSLQVGTQFFGFFKGIGRGPFDWDNQQDVIMIGTTFGIVWNR
jgi:hypothetical protein